MVDAGRVNAEPRRLACLHHLLGRKGGRDIDLGDKLAHEGVAHRTAGDARFPASLHERAQDPLQRRIFEPSLTGKRRKRSRHGVAYMRS